MCPPAVGRAPTRTRVLVLVLMLRSQVKGGGHTANPGFSSTPGVHIAMYRFSEVTYDEATENVVVGAGNVWDNVYATLEPLGRMVVGGRVSGVGVAGFTLGGGMCCELAFYRKNLTLFEVTPGRPTSTASPLTPSKRTSSSSQAARSLQSPRSPMRTFSGH